MRKENMNHAIKLLEHVSGDKYNETLKNIQDTMYKYGNDQWWLSNDVQYKAYRQANENMMLITPREFADGVNLILDKDFTMDEIAWLASDIREAVNKAWDKRLKSVKKSLKNNNRVARDKGKGSRVSHKVGALKRPR
ncbi:MAG: hypothetical protein LBM38_01900 [Clostridiales bacterium]|jgi:hypothetical protein|nr:hypothetical protein [Clostridiales bacterium]